MENILVVIVTYNGIKWVEKCLSSVEHSSVPADIYVVDNKSTDDTVPYIKKKFKGVTLIDSQENLGFGRANNLGMKYALEKRYRYVYLLNQDAWLMENTLEKLVEVSKKNPQYGILSPLQINNTETLDHNFQLCCSKRLVSDAIMKRPLDEVYETDYTMAAHWFIPVEALRKVGLFSPSFPHYGEDHDYANRVRYAGLKIGIVPQTKAIHDRLYRKTPKKVLLRQIYLEEVANISNPFLSPYKQSVVGPYNILRRSCRTDALVGVINAVKFLLNTPFYIKNRKISISSKFLDVE